MQKIILAALALSVVLVASEKVHAYVSYPWCVMGETRGMECYFSTKEQCAADEGGRGFGSLCIRNPDYRGAEGAVAGVRHRSHKHVNH